MRDLRDFSVGEWARLLPLQHAFKQVRNDLVLHAYQRRPAAGEAAFIAQCAALSGTSIGLIVAFEQPWALDWLLAMARRNVRNCTLLVFDNSRRESARADIAAVCARHGAPYLALPSNRTRHVNRSHGMAMSWVYERIVRALEPETFGFLDHDLIPVVPLDMRERIGTQDCFGKLNDSRWSWQLWAGYCFYRHARVRALPMNFLYDFSRGLDTGGRNWPWLYRRLARDTLRFAASDYLELCLPATGERRTVEVVDERWLHIGGVSYNNNFAAKQAFIEGIAAALAEGTPWSALLPAQG